MSDARWNNDRRDEEEDEDRPPRRSYSKRREIESADVPDSPKSQLKQVQMILILVGILQVGVNIVDLINVEKQLQAAEQSGARISSELVSLVKDIDYAAIVVGVSFVVLGFLVFKSPLICSITAFLIYLTSNIAFAAYVPIVPNVGLVIKILIGVALAKGIKSAAAIESEREPSRLIGLAIAGGTVLLVVGACAAIFMTNARKRPDPVAPSEPVVLQKDKDKETIATALTDLNSSERPRRVNAARKLLSMKPEDFPDQQKAVVAALASKIKGAGGDEITSALVAWIGPEDFQILVDALKDPQFGHRIQIIRALKRLKVTASADALAALLIDRFIAAPTIRDAQDALVSFGPTAEPAVLPLLEKANRDGKINVLQVLAKIGTAASLPAIDKLIEANAKDQQLVKEAEDAAKAIRQRKA